MVFASAGIAFLSSGAIFIPMARRGVLHGKNLLVGGAFYLAYLALVVGVVSGAIGGGAPSSLREPFGEPPREPLIYSGDRTEGP